MTKKQHKFCATDTHDNADLLLILLLQARTDLPTENHSQSALNYKNSKLISAA